MYACYFIASFPLVYWLDEPQARPHGAGVYLSKWSLTKVVESALAAGMIGFILLDLVAQFVIVDW